jgi:3-hydroxyacyl-CoA dehydrogenase
MGHGIAETFALHGYPMNITSKRKGPRGVMGRHAEELDFLRKTVDRSG